MYLHMSDVIVCVCALCTGFNRWEAAKAQLATATLGITGAISALLADDPRALGELGLPKPLNMPTTELGEHMWW